MRHFLVINMMQSAGRLVNKLLRTKIKTSTSWVKCDHRTCNFLPLYGIYTLFNHNCNQLSNSLWDNHNLQYSISLDRSQLFSHHEWPKRSDCISVACICHARSGHRHWELDRVDISSVMQWCFMHHCHFIVKSNFEWQHAVLFQAPSQWSVPKYIGKMKPKAVTTGHHHHQTPQCRSIGWSRCFLQCGFGVWLLSVQPLHDELGASRWDGM